MIDSDSDSNMRTFALTVPTAAPGDVSVEVVNTSLIKVSWTGVPKDKLNGRLGGYRVISPGEASSVSSACLFRACFLFAVSVICVRAALLRRALHHHV